MSPHRICNGLLSLAPQFTLKFEDPAERPMRHLRTVPSVALLLTSPRRHPHARLRDGSPPYLPGISSQRNEWPQLHAATRSVSASSHCYFPFTTPIEILRNPSPASPTMPLSPLVLVPTGPTPTRVTLTTGNSAFNSMLPSNPLRFSLLSSQRIYHIPSFLRIWGDMV